MRSPLPAPIEHVNGILPPPSDHPMSQVPHLFLHLQGLLPPFLKSILQPLLLLPAGCCAAFRCGHGLSKLSISLQQLYLYGTGKDRIMPEILLQRIQSPSGSWQLAAYTLQHYQRPCSPVPLASAFSSAVLAAPCLLAAAPGEPVWRPAGCQQHHPAAAGFPPAAPVGEAAGGEDDTTKGLNLQHCRLETSPPVNIISVSHSSML